MIVFEQSLSAEGTDSSPHIKSERAKSVGEDARSREHRHERELCGSQENLGGAVAYRGCKEDVFSRDREQYDAT